MEKFGLRRVYAHVFPFNRASMRVLEKAGYRREGVLRKDFEKDGKFSDLHVYAKVR
jgi:[ribosomal protein S5]-alanine N-acetyltransferase